MQMQISPKYWKVGTLILIVCPQFSLAWKLSPLNVDSEAVRGRSKLVEQLCVLPCFGQQELNVLAADALPKAKCRQESPKIVFYPKSSSGALREKRHHQQCLFMVMCIIYSLAACPTLAAIRVCCKPGFDPPDEH